MQGVSGASELQDQFLNLLVTQLRHQDPMNPTKQDQFLAQLAQFSTVEGIENLNTQFKDFAEAQLKQQPPAGGTQIQQMSTAASLVDKQITYTDEQGELQTGLVDAVIIQSDKAQLRVGDELVPLGEVRSIETPDSGPPVHVRRDQRMA